MVSWSWPGKLACLVLLSLFCMTFWALFHFAPISQSIPIFKDDALWRVIGFTLYQALLSTILSVIPACLIAYALFRREFYGKAILLKIMSVTIILPSLVVVFGIISIYGRNGFLTNLLKLFDSEIISLNIYGLSGILFAHVFFNLPFACLLIYRGLKAIPATQRKLAAQLNFTLFDTFKLIEWPFLKKQVFTVSVLIFTLCFSSFSIILTLGGGPKTTTIELAIFQALTYDYDFSRAAYLGLVQISICLVLLFISQYFKQETIKTSTSNWSLTYKNKFLIIIDYFLIFLVCLLILPPLLAIIISGINPTFWQSLFSVKLLIALSNSLIIGLMSAFLALLLANLLIWTARHCLLLNKPIAATFYISSGSIALIMPSLIIATGVYLLLLKFKLNHSILSSPYFLVSLVNGLLALPFVINLLYPYLTNTARQYHMLCVQHNIKGITRWWVVDFKSNIIHFKKAFAFALTLSLGDIGVMAFLGTQSSGNGFLTLPYLLFLQLGSYQSNQADATAFLLLMLVLGLFFFIEKKSKFFK